MECKHREMRNLNRNQGGGRGVAKENIDTFEHDRMCLVNEMRGQFFKLVMRSEGTFKSLDKKYSFLQILEVNFVLNMRSQEIH